MENNFREFKGEHQQGEEKKEKREKKKILFRRVALIIAAALVIGVLGIESVYSIGEQEQGVVTTFGKATGVATSGLHFKIPFVQKVTKVNTMILGFPIGYRLENEADNADLLAAESLMITSDFNFVNVDFYVEYKVSDPVKYLYHSKQPEEILKNIAQSCIRNIISNYVVDDVITTGKSEIQAAIREMMMEKLEEQDIGLILVNISMQDAEPPTDSVIEAFKAVETAKQGKETALNNANKYRNQKLPEANARADQIIRKAEAQKQERINEASAQQVRFQKMYEEYEKNPVITKQRMFYEAMESVLPGVKLIIDDGSGSLNKTLYLDELQLEDITQKPESTDDTQTTEQED